MKIDILVLNYNGKSLMEAYLPSIVEAADESFNDCDVYVVDNLSTDGSVEFLKEKFPSVKVVVAKENRVLCSYNEVVNGLDSDVVIFLNNDMKLELDFVDHLAKHFDEQDVMFVAPRLMNFDNTYNGGRSYLELKNGAIRMSVDEENFMQPGATHAISTGAFRRKAFVELGGFDDLYLPGIWEDVDICFRGLSLGWKGVYEPKSLLWHDESTTFHREYGKKGKMKIAHRNMFLFTWKNITDKKILAKHFALTLPRVIGLSLRGDTECLEGFLQAMKFIPKVMGKRNKWKKASAKKVLMDRDLIR